MNEEYAHIAFTDLLRAGSQGRASGTDALFVLSLGGGDAEHGVGVNVVRAVDEAKRRGIRVFGVVGRQQGYTKRFGHEVIAVPNQDPDTLTPRAEAFQAVIWPALVSRPRLFLSNNKWEDVVFSGTFPAGATEPARLRVKLFTDGADIAGIGKMTANLLIAGFTTNPSLMRQEGITDYSLTNTLLKKLPLAGKDLTSFSLDTVRGFRRDAIGANLSINTKAGA